MLYLCPLNTEKRTQILLFGGTLFSNPEEFLEIFPLNFILLAPLYHKNVSGVVPVDDCWLYSDPKVVE